MIIFLSSLLNPITKPSKRVSRMDKTILINNLMNPEDK